MGQLKPGATYIYEKADGVTYAREFGADPTTRLPIGWDFPRPMDTILGVPVSDISIYVEMHEAAKSNPALQKAIDQCKIVYHLSKEYGNQTQD